MRGPVDWAAQDWDDLVPRLLLLATSRLARMTWRGVRRGAIPGGLQPEDVVNDAIAKTIAGVRVWSRDCTLFQHLAGVVISDISHAANAIENRLGRDDGDDGHREPAADGPDQEQVALWRDEQRRLLAHLDGIDPRLAGLARLMLEQDLRDTAPLVAALGVPAAEIANLRKRLKRATRAWLLGGEA
ncbi:MAG TPA: hypothetical protein VFZ01_03545 [Geminicoccaceae bacterium]